jgi:toxin HigB-1
MINNFADKYTQDVWEGKRTRKWNPDIQKLALRKLFIIHAAGNINDLTIPPGNRLYKLKGDMKDFWAIRINDQWRIIFKWIDNKAFDVEIIDYH